MNGPEGPDGAARPWTPPGDPDQAPAAPPAPLGHEAPPWSRGSAPAPAVEMPAPTGPALYGHGYAPVAPAPHDQPPPPTRPPVGFPSPWPPDRVWMGFDDDSGRPPPRWGLPDVLLGLLSFVAGSFLGGAGVISLGVLATGQDGTSFTRGNVGLVGIVTLLGSWAGTIGFLVLITRIKGRGGLAADFGFRFTWWDPLIGLGAAFVTLVLSGLVQAWVSLLTGNEPATNADAIFDGVTGNTALLVLMSLMTTFGAPLVEELLFRGLALRAVEKRFGGVAAVLASSVLFGMLHYQFDGAPQLGLMAGIGVYGLMFALVTRWSGRLGPAVFTHVWVNGLATAVVLAGVLTR
jgi:membrane protease YdiL (CAAX protease family)